MHYSIITISGQLGSGKSTITKLLSDKLGWTTYSTGQAQRLIAKKYGISTLELNQRAITDKSIDDEIDGVFKNPPWGNQSCVVDSRLAFHFLPQSLKVCLRVAPKVAAERVFNEHRALETYSSVEQAQEYLQKRRQFEQEHFMKNYGLDIDRDDLFDLIIDTTHMTPDEICRKIISVL